MEKAENNKSGVRFTITLRMLLIVIIPLLTLAIVLTTIAGTSMKNALQNEALVGLGDTTTAIRAAYTAVDSGDYYLNDAGELMKGDFNLSQNIAVIDSFTEGSSMEATICYGDTRMITSFVDASTGERMAGTQVSDAVKQAVLDNGGTYTSVSATVNGQNYYAFYEPLYNSDGSIIGIIFAGEPSAEVEKIIISKIVVIIVGAIIITIISIVVATLLILSIAKSILEAEHAVEILASGDLTVNISDKITNRSDEIGDMSRAVNRLSSKLREIIGNIKSAADRVLVSGNELEIASSQTSANADEISKAVEEISNGAVSQAEEVEQAMTRVVHIGNIIGDIADGMNRMSSATSIMSQNGNESVSIIEELNSSTDQTMNAIERIGNQVRATDNSVAEISEAITLITGIADETNLLSLNASIEAARAGTAGRGFAVVASQIQKLAEESNISALKIEDVINHLSAESKTSIRVMEELQQIVLEQKEKLDETKAKFLQVNQGIGESRNETTTVNQKTEECDENRAEVVDVIQNLSAISEENAASAEETTASMQELNSTINQLAEEAGELKNLAQTLNKEMEFFKM